MIDDKLAAYCTYFITLTPQSLAQLEQHVTEDIVFIDPFHTIRGVTAMRAMFEKMFARVDSPKFIVHRALRDESQGYIHWRFTCMVRGRQIAFDGMSHVILAEDGRISLHKDYWDSVSELYTQLPFIGSILRRLFFKDRADFAG